MTAPSLSARPLWRKLMMMRFFFTSMRHPAAALVLAAAFLAAGSSAADDLFDGQILSLNEPKEQLKPSNDPRYVDNGDGTVTDLAQGLMWKQEDSYQELKKWMNWKMAGDYIAELNSNQFAGHADWRLPTRDELASLYDEKKSIPWKYYWTVNQVHMDPIFGYTSCCFWSSEVKDDTYAWTFNFIRGKAYPSPRQGPGLSLSAIRPVRGQKKAAAQAQ